MRLFLSLSIFRRIRFVRFVPTSVDRGLLAFVDLSIHCPTESCCHHFLDIIIIVVIIIISNRIYIMSTPPLPHSCNINEVAFSPGRCSRNKLGPHIHMDEIN